MKKQQREVEKAVIGYGEYRLRPQYSSLAVTVEKWFKLSQAQRQQCIRKFNKATVQQSMACKEMPSANDNVATTVLLSPHDEESCLSPVSTSHEYVC